VTGAREARVTVSENGDLCIYLLGAPGQRVSVTLDADGGWAYAVIDGDRVQVWASDSGFDAGAMRAEAHKLGIGVTP
jgi:hypothetical protein